MFKFVKYNTIPVVSTLYVQYMCVYVCVCVLNLTLCNSPHPHLSLFRGLHGEMACTFSTSVTPSHRAVQSIQHKLTGPIGAQAVSAALRHFGFIYY